MRSPGTAPVSAAILIGRSRLTPRTAISGPPAFPPEPRLWRGWAPSCACRNLDAHGPQDIRGGHFTAANRGERVFGGLYSEAADGAGELAFIDSRRPTPRACPESRGRDPHTGYAPRCG